MAYDAEGIKLCDSYCKGCVFERGRDVSKFPACVYILRTNKRRPCPAGTGCVVRRSRRGGACAKA